MPGGGGRKKPFSGKQKKAQLQSKKQAGLHHPQHHRAELGEDDDRGETSSTIVKRPAHGITSEDGLESSKFFENRPAPSRMNPGRYALMFRAETKEEVQRLKNDARKPMHPIDEEYLECASDDFYTSELDFPVRPEWNYALSPDQLEKNEARYFQEYLRKIDQKYERSDLSYFEMNLETWRQFWRVLEMSDILLCVVDIRFPPLLFPPRLYDYVCKTLGKNIIIVLNKIDLCPAPLVLAWKDYFTTTYKGLQVVCFTSFPAYNLHGNLAEGASGTMKKARRVRGRLRMAAEGAMEVYKVCEELVKGQVDLTKWKQKISDEMNISDENSDECKAADIDNVESLQKQDTGYYEFKQFHSGILTIGCVGQPNVGKSSLINALMGKKVVSVSKTPGHTKHFQTIFLTQNVRLCDCPGLIFPSKVPKPLQVLCGSYPIAQLREPYSTVHYLGQRIDLAKMLGIQHPEGKDETDWSAFDIADGWALKRSYYTAKAARLDSYRGANHILRLALDGRIIICLRPKGYTSRKEEFSNDPRIEEILTIQAKSGPALEKVDFNLSDTDDVDEDNDVQLPPGFVPAEDNDSEHDGKGKQLCLKERAKPTIQNKFAMLGQLEDDDDDSD
ncbi:guanine nucleotide-binding protein-like 1 [Folsomia candida]|uniref:Guanine nucleotide-binding protein-like 1 n=1 Tax=Folsomia candida TaxID=158441 RepID=A0A226EYP5_FOLCA|nr:guanine nucleotide-binding protein-like 1 [Folsomia candida]XP_035702742.1 guanine nucleotide-binding protein-like 1 [Folsomia candida]XP_035702743.1 guanine nucleotide-binding protein-like 1 [Folsomia candida]OXA62659.1 Guanine nucleotide-binding protein-like 1 [Folsomia candida]